MELTTVWARNWEEFERGWGCRPDGVTIHLTEADAVKYATEYNEKYNSEKTVPDEYTVPVGNPFTVHIDSELFLTLNLKGNCVWVTDQWYRTNSAAGKILKNA